MGLLTKGWLGGCLFESSLGRSMDMLHASGSSVLDSLAQKRLDGEPGG
jgi:hypothetical protein